MPSAASHAALRIGLTGGIGSGKSTVARRLAERGACLVDADAISRACTAPGGAAIAAIRETFGARSIQPDGSMDRTFMRERAFADPQVRRALEAIIHPIVARETAALIAGSGTSTLVFDVPLLVESGYWPGRVDYVWVVDCSTNTQVSRVQARSGWDPASVDAVISQQASRERRLAAADAVIFNDDIDLHALHTLVDALAVQFGL